MGGMVEGTVQEEEKIATTPLGPAHWADFRRQAYRMLDDMLGSMETVHEGPAWHAIADEARAHSRGAHPVKPAADAKFHKEFS
jgi:hypothetical protein